MTTFEVLRATRAKLEQGWTQHTSARDADGAPCIPFASRAVCWCILGAVAATGASVSERAAALLVLRRFTGGALVQVLNDSRASSKDAMLDLLDKGIAAAEVEAA